MCVHASDFTLGPPGRVGHRQILPGSENYIMLRKNTIFRKHPVPLPQSTNLSLSLSLSLSLHLHAFIFIILHVSISSYHIILFKRH